MAAQRKSTKGRSTSTRDLKPRKKTSQSVKGGNLVRDRSALLDVATVSPPAPRKRH